MSGRTTVKHKLLDDTRKCVGWQLPQSTRLNIRFLGISQASRLSVRITALPGNPPNSLGKQEPGRSHLRFRSDDVLLMQCNGKRIHVFPIRKHKWQSQCMPISLSEIFFNRLHICFHRSNTYFNILHQTYVETSELLR